MDSEWHVHPRSWPWPWIFEVISSCLITTASVDMKWQKASRLQLLSYMYKWFHCGLDFDLQFAFWRSLTPRNVQVILHVYFSNSLNKLNIVHTFVKSVISDCHTELHWWQVKLTLVQVMAWCHQAISHYFGQCWPRSCNDFRTTFYISFIFWWSHCHDFFMKWKKEHSDWSLGLKCSHQFLPKASFGLGYCRCLHLYICASLCLSVMSVHPCVQ